MHFNKILKNTIIWKLLNTVFVFFINLLMVRLLGISESGIFFYNITILSLLVLILSWSLESGITYYTIKENVNLQSILHILIPILIFQSLLSWLIIQNIRLSISGLTAILFVLGNLCYTYFSALFYSKKWFILINTISCSVNFLVILLLLFGWFFFNSEIINHQYYTLIYILGITFQAVLLILVLVLKANKTKVQPIVLQPLIRKIFTYSSVAFISNVVFFLVTRIDYFFVEKYCSIDALSNYVQVSKFGQLLILVPSVIASMVFPYSADRNDFFSLNNVQQLCKTISFFFIPITIMIVLTGSWILPLIFGKDFNLMYIAMLLYIPGFYALSIISVLAAYLAGKKHLSVNLIASLLALIIVVTGDLLLIPVWGINAAASVSSLGYISCGCYMIRFYKIKFNCAPSTFFSFKKRDIFYILTQFKNHKPVTK